MDTVNIVILAIIVGGMVACILDIYERCVRKYRLLRVGDRLYKEEMVEDCYSEAVEFIVVEKHDNYLLLRSADNYNRRIKFRPISFMSGVFMTREEYLDSEYYHSND